MSFFQILSEWTANNPGKTFGAIAGFVLGLLIFIFGIIKTLIIFILALVGYFIGKSRDDDISIIEEITGLFKGRKNIDDDEI